jgi:hypothetical protein
VHGAVAPELVGSSVQGQSHGSMLLPASVETAAYVVKKFSGVFRVIIYLAEMCDTFKC